MNILFSTFRFPFYNSKFNYKKYNKKILRGLLFKLTNLCKKQNVKCIIAHGSLIGYHFNKKCFLGMMI